MRFKERISQDIATYRSLSGKARREFVWDYYKLPIVFLAGVLTLAMLISVLNLGREDTVMYAVLINANDEADSSVFPQIMTDSGADMTEKTVDVAANYALRYDDVNAANGETVQVLAALFGIGDLDLFVADEPVFTSYAKQEAFADLSLFLEKEDLERHQLYTYRDKNGREIVAGIWLKEGSPLHQAGYYRGDVVIGVAARAQNLDPAVAFVKQLVTGSPSS